MSTALRVQRAKRTYETWAFRVGALDAWERLTDQHQAAWFDVVSFVEDEIEDEGYHCAECGTDVVCPKCEDVKCVKCQTDAALEAKTKKAGGLG